MNEDKSNINYYY